MAPISSKISGRRVGSVIGARYADFNKLGGEDAEKAMYHPGELESTFRIGEVFGDFCGEFIDKCLHQQGCNFSRKIEDFGLYDNYPMHAHRGTFKNFSKCFRIIRGIRIHM